MRYYDPVIGWNIGKGLTVCWSRRRSDGIYSALQNVGWWNNIIQRLTNGVVRCGYRR